MRIFLETKNILEKSNMMVMWLRMDSNVKDVLTSGKRDKTEIMAAIIAMTQKPSNITRIMGQVNLSHTILRKYLKLMLRRSLMEEFKVAEATKSGQVFQATEKGLSFLKIYCDILRIIYGVDFMQNKNNLAVACLKYCKQV
jgi:predicted transcriptional regulator